MSAWMCVQSIVALRSVLKALGIFGPLEKWFHEEEQLE